MSINRKKPHKLLRLALRLPILFYRFHLGWLLGERFLLLTHTGRKSGIKRQSVIEVIRHDKISNIYIVASGFGHKSDWLLNITQNSAVFITVKRRTLSARARVLSEEDAARELRDYAKRHPIAFRWLSRILTGKSMTATEQTCYEFAKSVPIVAFQQTEH